MLLHLIRMALLSTNLYLKRSVCDLTNEHQLIFMWDFIHWSVSLLFFSPLYKWFNFWLAGNFTNQRSGHSGSFRICGQFWDGTRTDPMVHSGRVIFSGSTSGSHGCGGVLQLDRQLNCRTVFPTTNGKSLVAEFSNITFCMDTRAKHTIMTLLPF